MSDASARVTRRNRDAAEIAPRPEHHHRDIDIGRARAAVFGVSDGLVSNVSLILGVAGANPGAGFVRLAGLAGSDRRRGLDVGRRVHLDEGADRAVSSASSTWSGASCCATPTSRPSSSRRSTSRAASIPIARASSRTDDGRPRVGVADARSRGVGHRSRQARLADGRGGVVVRRLRDRRARAVAAVVLRVGHRGRRCVDHPRAHRQRGGRHTARPLHRPLGALLRRAAKWRSPCSPRASRSSSATSSASASPRPRYETLGRRGRP